MKQTVLFLILVSVFSSAFAQEEIPDTIRLSFQKIPEYRINISGIEELVIDNDSVFQSVLNEDDSVQIRKIDFSKEMIVVRNIFADSHAQIEHEVLYISKEEKILILETIWDGGACGMMFSSHWLLIQRPEIVKKTETESILKRKNNY